VNTLLELTHTEGILVSLYESERFLLEEDCGLKHFYPSVKKICKSYSINTLKLLPLLEKNR